MNHRYPKVTRKSLNISQMIGNDTEENFMKFIYEQTDDTWTVCYIALYLAVRGSSLKQMGPLFAVLDWNAPKAV